MGSVVGSVIGSVISARGAKKAAQAQASAAERNAQLAYEQSLPWDIKGILGGATFDEEGKLGELTLSPELQKLYEERLARTSGISAGIGAFDPAAYQQQFYEEQRALAAPGEERERLALENRLRRQGLLTATAGASQARGLEEALQMKDLARRAEARGAAQQEQTFLRGLESQDLGTALQLGALPMDYATLGRGIGAGLSSVAQSGATMRNQAAQNVADTQAAFWSKLGGTIGSYGQPNQYQQYFGAAQQYGFNPFGGGSGAMPLNINSGMFSYGP